MYLSPSSCSPGSHNTWNIIGFWIPFGRIETVNCRINILNLYWLWTETSQSQRSRRNGASWEYCSCGWLLSRRCRLRWSRCSCRWFCRTRIFDTLLNGCRPVLTSAIGRIDDTAILQATADDPFGLSNSARDWTLKGKAFVRIIQPLFVSIAKEMKHHKFSTPSRNRIHKSAIPLSIEFVKSSSFIMRYRQPLKIQNPLCSNEGSRNPEGAKSCEEFFDRKKKQHREMEKSLKELRNREREFATERCAKIREI